MQSLVVNNRNKTSVNLIWRLPPFPHVNKTSFINSYQQTEFLKIWNICEELLEQGSFIIIYYD